MIFSLDLAGVPALGAVTSRSITAENPTGEKAAGGKAASALGVGRKGRPYVGLGSGQTTALADIRGPGVIRHIWLTVAEQTAKSPFVLRNLVLRCYWDGESSPSVEVPLGDFFCNGFGRRCLINSVPIAVAPTGGMNSYFAMPFDSSARIEVTSEHPDDIRALFFQIDYHLVDELPRDTGRFHAQWRRESITELGRDFVVVDGISGVGAYVGTYLGIAALERYWWGEGEFKFFIDGDGDWPTVCGTGIEDYFGGAWAFQDHVGASELQPVTFSYPYFGYPLYAVADTIGASPYVRATTPMHGMYRWHLPDPIHFREGLRVTVQQIGHGGESGLFERRDDVTAVAYWYQHEPHAPFPQLPSAQQRQPR